MIRLSARDLSRLVASGKLDRTPRVRKTARVPAQTEDKTFMADGDYTLPWPPSVNHYWRIFRNRMIVSAAGRAYRADAMAAILDSHGLVKPITLPCQVSIVAFPPDRRRRDLDNICKAALDALKAGRVIEDDSLIDELRVHRGIVVSGGKLEVKVTVMEF